MIHIDDEIYMDLKFDETNVDDFDLYEEVNTYDLNLYKRA